MNNKIIILLFLFNLVLIPFVLSDDLNKNFIQAQGLYRDRKLNEAINSAKIAISEDPKQSIYFTFIGNIYNETKNYKDAEVYFNKALNVNLKDSGALNGLGLRYDGNGYPDKIAGENLNVYAAIVSVADAYDAMSSQRAYRGALTRDHAIDELKRNKGSQFDPKVVDILLQILAEEKM